MKVVESPNRGVETSGMGETVAFTIATDGAIIRNVISSIYSHREKTVVRELMANGFDGHAKAGKEKVAIEVFLPTTFDSTFAVRDFGCGMSHEFVMKLYSVIGHSTKRNDNNQTGAFGVGSKSPLSICDAFTLRCFDAPTPEFPEGRVRMYNIGISNSDIPEIAHTFSVTPRPDDRVEEGGVEVKVPVHSSDRAKLLAGLASQHFCWFDKPVKFNGALDEVAHRFYPMISNLSGKMYLAQPSSASGVNWNVFVRQGAAVYPLDKTTMQGSRLGADIIDTMQQLCKNGRHLMIDLPIGTADVTMAREAIQYNPTTTANIVKALTAEFTALSVILTKAIGDARDFSSAMTRLLPALVPNAPKKEFFASRILASAVLPLVKDSIEANHAKWYKALPDVVRQRRKTDSAGNYIFAANGDYEMESFNDRPVDNPPRIDQMIRTADFPEGKVLLHTGEVYQSSGGPYLSLSGVKTDFRNKYPAIYYVIPSHLQKWQDRLGVHAKKELAEYTMGDNASTGVAVVVVRCAKRNSDAVVDTLKARGLACMVFDHTAMPDIVIEAERQKTYSKTSVYPFKNNQWSDAKVEPDYSKPAYYVVRIGVSSDCELLLPGAPKVNTPYGTPWARKNQCSYYDMRSIIEHAIQLGFLDQNYPIYRVTENQGIKIKQTCPEWKHIGDTVADVAKQEYMTNRASILESASFQRSTYMLDVLLKETDKPQTECGKLAIDIVNTLVDVDPLFRTVVGTKEHVKTLLAKKRAAVSVTTREERVLKLVSCLYNSIQDDSHAKEVQRLEALIEKFTKRYRHIENFHSHSSGGSAEQLRHLSYYIKGYSSDLKNETNDLTRYADLVPYGTEYQKKINAVKAAIPRSTP